MGITGLLPLLSSITKSVHIQELQGLTIAIDAYSWLHRGMYGPCAIDRFNGINNLSFVPYCMSRINYLLQWNIKPILVFDGDNLPIKGIQEVGREMVRLKARENIKRKMFDGSSYNIDIQKQVDVTPELASKLIKELILHKIPYLVAPYEADAQMAFLDETGKIDAIITEDSDLLVFGAKRVLFKFDYRTGFAQEICIKERLHECRDLDLTSFSFKQFRQLCILSGCDYLENIPSIGFKTAYRFFISNGNCIKSTLRDLRLTFPSKIPSNYEENFQKAELTFDHQRVFDDETRKMIHLKPLPSSFFTEEGDDLHFLGPLKSDSLSYQISMGFKCPITGKSFDVKNYTQKEDDFIPMSPIKDHISSDKMRITLSRLSVSSLSSSSSSSVSSSSAASFSTLTYKGGRNVIRGGRGGGDSKISKNPTQRSIKDFFIKKIKE